MKIIALTGGTASGKSEVAKIFSEYHIPVLNLDQIGRELTDRSAELRSKIAEACGQDVLQGNTLDRLKVREKIFNDPRTLRKVEEILHPVILKEFKNRASALDAQGHSLIICEAALIFESGIDKILDGVIVVDAPFETRLKRLMERDRIEESLARQIFSQQISDTERMKRADFILSNEGDKTNLKTQVERLLTKLKKRGWLQ